MPRPSASAASTDATAPGQGGRERGLPSPCQIFAAQILVAFAHVSVDLKSTYGPVIRRGSLDVAARAIACTIPSVSQDALREHSEGDGSKMLPYVLCSERQGLGWQIWCVGRRWGETSLCDSLSAPAASLSWCLLPSPTIVAESSISLVLAAAQLQLQAERTND